ncbi:MAG: hypothetical protein WBX15_19060 [Thermoanaerobaculia bacterium]
MNRPTTRWGGVLQVVFSMSLLAFFGVDAHAGCNWSSRYSGAYRHSALDVFVDGNDLWSATSYGVTLYDRTIDPPRPIGSVEVPGPTSRVRAGGGFAWAASGSSIYAIRKGTFPVLAGAVDTGGTINDLLYSPPYLYAATTDGIVQIDLLVSDQPLVAGRLSTTAGGAKSLTLLNGVLYAADGDATLDVYSLAVPSLPQKIGTIDTLPRASFVATIGDRLLASDGFQTDVFSGSGTAMSRQARMSEVGAVGLFPSTAQVGFIADGNRRLRAVDLTDPTRPSILFSWDLIPSGGTVTRFTAITGAGGRLYAAAGDSGVVTFRMNGFESPYPLREYGIGATSSIASFADRVVLASDAGGLIEMMRSNGLLVPSRSWDAPRVSTIRDSDPGKVLSSSGAQLFLWDLTPSIPVLSSTATFPSGVRAAVLSGNGAWAALTDGSLWKADFSLPSATLTRVDVTGFSPSFLARSGASIASAELEPDGTTRVRYFPDGDLSAPQQGVSFEGATVSGIALNAAGTVAGATFKGISVARFGTTGGVQVLPGSATGPIRALALQGDILAASTSNQLQLWNVASGTLVRSLPLPSDARAASAFPASPFRVDVATSSGVVSAIDSPSSVLPELIPATSTNSYYRSIAAGPDVLWLASDSGVAAYDMDGVQPHLRTLQSVPGAVGVASVGDLAYVLTTSLEVEVFDASGRLIRRASVAEGNDVVPLGIANGAGAVWVSISRGCLSGSCEKTTLVLDPATLQQTSSMSGEVVDAVLAAPDAFVLSALPDEIRVVNVAGPLHPLIRRSRPSEGSAVSIAYSGNAGAIYTLGERLLVYDEISLSQIGTLLDPWSRDDSGRVSFVDQRVRIHDGCAIVAGRSFAPALFQIRDAVSWDPVSAPSVPAAVRAIASSPGTFFLLSDYSLEVWSTQPPPVHRRSVER